MAEKYNPAEIESKWQQRWEADGLYHSDIDPDKPKYYALTMLPYPSGDLHIGHWYAMSPSDARARYLRMNGYNVLFPMGFDAFGLPAENAARQRGIHPYEWTIANVENMRRQLRSMGAMFDWRREAVTCLPGYYRWSQWFFCKMYEMGLAYRAFAPVDFCPNCNTTLGPRAGLGRGPPLRAMQHAGGQERAEPVVFQDHRTTPTSCLISARSTGPNGSRPCKRTGLGAARAPWLRSRPRVADTFDIFTTRPDTLWGATFMVLAPEHPLGGQADDGCVQGRGRGVQVPGRPPERDRARGDGQGKDGRVYRRLCHQSGQRGAHPDLDRGLCHDDLWHRRDHGRSVARRARFCSLRSNSACPSSR